MRERSTYSFGELLLQLISPGTIQQSGGCIRIDCQALGSSTLAELLLAYLLILDKEVDEVFVVHNLLILHGHYLSHLVLEGFESLHQHLAILDEAVDNFIIISLDLVLIAAGLVDRDHLTESCQHLICTKVWKLCEACLDIPGRA